LTVKRAENYPNKKDRPDLKMVEWKNSKTGKTELAPEGIHPAFAYNSGKVELRKKSLNEARADSKKQTQNNKAELGNL
jgi:hypothetical protein